MTKRAFEITVIRSMENRPELWRINQVNSSIVTNDKGLTITTHGPFACLLGTDGYGFGFLGSIRVGCALKAMVRAKLAAQL